MSAIDTNIRHAMLTARINYKARVARYSSVTKLTDSCISVLGVAVMYEVENDIMSKVL